MQTRIRGDLVAPLEIPTLELPKEGSHAQEDPSMKDALFVESPAFDGPALSRIYRNGSTRQEGPRVLPISFKMAPLKVAPFLAPSFHLKAGLNTRDYLPYIFRA